MFDALQSISASAAAILAGLSAGASWVAVVIVPNEAFDHMDYSRADRHVRHVLKTASGTITILLLVAAALAFLGGAVGGSVLSLLAAFGFFSNRWTLANRKPRTAPPGTRRKVKSQRIVAVSISLMFGLTALVAAGLSAAGL